MPDNLNEGRPWLLVHCYNPSDFGPDTALIPCSDSLAVFIEQRQAAIQQLDQALAPSLVEWMDETPIFFSWSYGDSDDESIMDELADQVENELAVMIDVLPRTLATIVEKHRAGVRGAKHNMPKVNDCTLRMRPENCGVIWWSAHLPFTEYVVQTEDVNVDMLRGLR